MKDYATVNVSASTVLSSLAQGGAVGDWYRMAFNLMPSAFSGKYVKLGDVAISKEFTEFAAKG